MRTAQAPAGQCEWHKMAEGLAPAFSIPPAFSSMIIPGNKRVPQCHRVSSVARHLALDHHLCRSAARQCAHIHSSCPPDTPNARDAPGKTTTYGTRVVVRV